MIVSYPVKDVWPHILPRIEAMHRKHADHLDWQPDEVFDALWTKRACLFCNDEDDSFCIAKIKYRGARKILFIWIGYGPNGSRAKNLARAKEIARGVGAVSIEWGSPRRGFDRVKECRRVTTTYSMEV